MTYNMKLRNDNAQRMLIAMSARGLADDMGATVQERTGGRVTVGSGMWRAVALVPPMMGKGGRA